MCFDRFLLAVESRGLSQADKSVIRVSSYSILQNFNFWTTKFIVILKTTIFSTWQFGVLVNFIIKKFIRLKSEQFSQFFWQEVNVKFDKSHFAECSGHSCWEIKKVLHYPSLILGKKKLITLLSAWDGSRDSTAKRNLSNHM